MVPLMPSLVLFLVHLDTAAGERPMMRAVFLTPPNLKTSNSAGVKFKLAPSHEVLPVDRFEKRHVNIK